MDRVFSVYCRSDNKWFTIDGKEALAKVLDIPLHEVPDGRLFKWSVGDYVVVEVNET